MPKRIEWLVFIILLISGTTHQGFSQILFGNEWIVRSQSYIKFSVHESGVYRLTYSDLKSIGFFNSSTDPKYFQVFNLGKEVPIYIAGAEDGSFDPNDYIELYCKSNSGEADQPLYQKTSDQPNSEVSLFSPEAVYFLTIATGKIGKRFSNPKVNLLGLNPEKYAVSKVSSNFDEQYYPGAYLLDVMTLSEFIEGEGYLGQTFSLGSSQTRTISLPFKYTTASYPSTFEFYLAGRSNAVSTNASGFNHHLKISVNNSLVFDTLYKAYNVVRSTIPININDISQSTAINFSSINDLGASTDFQAPGYIRFTYPRSFDVSSVNRLEFSLPFSNGNRLVRLENSTWTRSTLMDLNNNKIYNGIKTGSNVDFAIENSGNGNLIVYDDTFIKKPALEPVTFTVPDAQAFNSRMLIVTHSSLKNGALNVSAYKNSKGITSTVVDVNDIYNQFYYGLHHPLAIRNFCSYLLKNAASKPQFLFLIGKAYDTPRGRLNQDLVPTFGFPASDNGLTSALIDNNLAPALATGRLPAKTDQEVLDYLEKIKLYDAQPDSLWRKTFINISGGNTSSEDVAFSNYLKNFTTLASKEYFGTKEISFFKSVTDPVTDNLTTKINKTINNGAQILNFFGHGSAISTAVSIGNPIDLTNRDKLLFYKIDGCSTGNAFSTSSLGETYIFQKQKGAIGWIGTSSEGVASYLANYGNLFYANSFKNFYGQSVAQNIQQSIRNFQNPSDLLNRAHAMQFIFLGDPSLKFYSPAKPDYEIRNQDISLSTINPTASSGTLEFSLIIKNIGKGINNPLKISLKRTLPDNSIVTYPTQQYLAVFNTDTLNFKINNDVNNSAGNNKFSFILDPDNNFDELNELNNTGEFNYFFPSNGATLIFPAEYGILSNPVSKLKVQANNLLSSNNNFVFEIDTVKTFDSTWKKSSGTISGGTVAEWLPNIKYENKKVYYWRAKLDIDARNGGQWRQSSFTYIQSSPDGWNQGHYQQFDKISLNNIRLNQDRFEYTKTAYPMLIRTRGNDAPTSTERAIRVGIRVAKLSFNTSEFNGITIIAFDPVNSARLVNYPSVYNFKNDGVNGTGQYYFNPEISSEADSLLDYLNNIPQGFYVVGMSGINFAPKTMSASLQNAFRQLGLTQFLQVEAGEPYAFSGIKGGPAGNASERTADYASPVPARSQSIEFSFDLLNNWDNGTFVSEKIGPASSWNSALFNFDINQNDLISYSIIGVNNAGQESILYNNITSANIDLTPVSANQYPYLKISANAKDNNDFTVAELNNWTVLFDGYSDVSINVDYKNNFHSAELARGDSLKLELGLSNLSPYKSDSITVNYVIVKSDRTKITGSLKTLTPLDPDSNTFLKFSFPTDALTGDNLLQVIIDQRNKQDKYDFNNQLSFPFKVVADEKPPLLSVLFDGKNIINGEIISPSAKISISVLDENKFLLLSDTSSIELFLKDMDAAAYSRIFFSSGKLSLQQKGTASNNKSTFLYNPGSLKDGSYTLKVKSKDVSGNYMNNDYVTNFEVINEQSITNFLPYPNPFTTSMRFVYQITGKEPDKIKVQILTSSGKIVREILKEELGSMSVGNNISEFVWDGTDQFGDKLANGVYFYRVLTENSDESNIKSRGNVTDKFFTQKIGKIYLMR